MDEKIRQLTSQEVDRQKTTIELIASENYVSAEVLNSMGSVLTNKYSQGTPYNRFYPGNEIINKIERLCEERALKLFSNGIEYCVNVQPYSGSSANLAVYTAVLSPGDTFMGMNMEEGGHMTHGYKTRDGRPVSATAMFWNSVLYGVDIKTELIDYENIEKLAKENKPKLIVAGVSSYTRFLDFCRLKKIADSVSALLMVDMAHVAGLVASKLYPSPFDYADIVTTTTHKTLRGPRAGMIFCKKNGTIIKGGVEVSLKERIDSAIYPELQGGPHNNVTAAVAVCLFEASQNNFVEYSKQVLANCKTMERFFKEKNYRLVSDGSDNHMLLINTKASCGIWGGEAENILNSIGISVNRNSCPGDESEHHPTGIRIGTPAITTRGFGPDKVLSLCEIMHLALSGAKTEAGERENRGLVEQLRARVLELCLRK